MMSGVLTSKREYLKDPPQEHDAKSYNTFRYQALYWSVGEGPVRRSTTMQPTWKHRVQRGKPRSFDAISSRNADICVHHVINQVYLFVPTQTLQKAHPFCLVGENNTAILVNSDTRIKKADVFQAYCVHWFLFVPADASYHILKARLTYLTFFSWIDVARQQSFLGIYTPTDLINSVTETEKVVDAKCRNNNRNPNRLGSLQQQSVTVVPVILETHCPEFPPFSQQVPLLPSGQIALRACHGVRVLTVRMDWYLEAESDINCGYRGNGDASVP